jgi:glycosyltransferase involved in cell wall biosynthesis
VLAELLGAEILDRTDVDGSATARAIRRIAGVGPAQAWLAFRRRHRFDVVFTDGEQSGIPLALLLAASRSRTRLITIGHRLTSPKKRFFLRTLRAPAAMHRIALHSRHQYDFARAQLGIPARRLALLPYQVDTDFWTPARPIDEERLVVSAGLEHRDYPTLIRAARGLTAQVIIGAASRWSRHAFVPGALPLNVRVGSFDYHALRDLYARAAVVVVPLVDVDNQAGVTTILEAMAMGKAVVVAQSVGQTDVVEDRRARTRGAPRPRPVSLARILAADRGVTLEPNGFYVPPGDPDALIRAVGYLLDHPEERARLGAAGRRAAMQLFSVDEFAARMRALMDPEPPRDGAYAVPHLQYG